MRNRDTTEETESDSSVFDRFRGGSEDDLADTDSQAGSDSLFGRARAKYGLGVLLAAIGVVLVVIPEPATSAAGFGLILVGALIWLVSWLR